jgi:hypothetical protein
MVPLAVHAVLLLLSRQTDAAQTHPRIAGMGMQSAAYCCTQAFEITSSDNSRNTCPIPQTCCPTGWQQLAVDWQVAAKHCSNRHLPGIAFTSLIRFECRTMGILQTILEEPAMICAQQQPEKNFSVQIIGVQLTTAFDTK